MQVHYADSFDTRNTHIENHFASNGRNAVTFETSREHILLLDVSHRDVDTLRAMLNFHDKVRQIELYVYGMNTASTAHVAPFPHKPLGDQCIERHYIGTKRVREHLETSNDELFEGSCIYDADRYAVTMLATLLTNNPIFDIRNNIDETHHVYRTHASAEQYLTENAAAFRNEYSEQSVLENYIVTTFEREDGGMLRKTSRPFQQIYALKIL